MDFGLYDMGLVLIENASLVDWCFKKFGCHKLNIDYFLCLMVTLKEFFIDCLFLNFCFLIFYSLEVYVSLTP